MKITQLIALSACALVSLASPAQTIALPYESVFKDYQTHQDVPLRDWKVSNETVRKAGGWREYLKESQVKQSQAPDAAKDGATASAAASATNSSKSAVDHDQHTQTIEMKKP